MLLSKTTIKILSYFWGENDARYILNGLHCTPKEVVATDGHRLGIITHRPADETEAFAPFTLDSADAERVEKTLQKPHKGQVSEAMIEAGNRKGAEVPVTIGDVTMSAVILEGQYPRYEQVLPKHEPGFRTYVNPRYLKEMGEAFARFTQGRSLPQVCIECFDGMEALRFRAKDPHTGQEFIALLMPQKGKVYGPNSGRIPTPPQKKDEARK